jgi:hypothetical protein
MMLSNASASRVAFKVKTTSPKKYCVRPSSGVVEAGQAREVQVIMQSQREAPPSFADCRDKFLVQAVPVGADVKEATSEMFDPAKARDVRQTKLRVVLVPPARPPSPVPEGTEDDAASPGPPPRSFQERLNALGATPATSGGVKMATRPPVAAAPRGGGFGLLSLLLVAILALVVGTQLQAALPALLAQAHEAAAALAAQARALTKKYA